MEQHLHRGKGEKECFLKEGLEIVGFSVFKQDYSKLHHVVVIVTASLNVNSSRNTVLKKAETQVSAQHLPPISCQVPGSEAPWLRVFP